MKTEELIALALAGVAVFLIFKSSKAGAASPFVSTWKKVTEVLSPSGARFDNGWRYFDDGTSISPEGDYYTGGNLVWSPAK